MFTNLLIFTNHTFIKYLAQGRFSIHMLEFTLNENLQKCNYGYLELSMLNLLVIIMLFTNLSIHLNVRVKSPTTQQ